MAKKNNTPAPAQAHSGPRIVSDPDRPQPPLPTGGEDGSLSAAAQALEANFGEELDSEFGEVSGEYPDGLDGVDQETEELLGQGSEEGEDDPADSGEIDGEDDGSDDDAADLEELFKVTVDGEEVEVPLSELIRGYSRTQDYTRKTQAVASERREVQQQAERLAGMEEAYLHRLNAAAQFMGEKLGLEGMQALQREYQAVQALAMERRNEEFRARLSEESELLEDAIPAWRNPKVAEKEKAELREFVLGLGYTDQDLASVADHRLIVVLHKAHQFDKLQSNSSERRDQIRAKAKRAAVLRPGGRTEKPRGPARARREAFERLRQSGSSRDAAAAIEAFLD